jgi:hypothetical protein
VPPIVTERSATPTPNLALSPSAAITAPTLYSIGSPTDEEQLYVELINRARADANAEATRLAQTTDPDVLAAYSAQSVDLPLFIQQMATQVPSVPPLAINATLTDMARLHSQDQRDEGFQGHTSSANPPPPFSPGDGIAERATAIGYGYQRIAENVFAFAKSVFYGHAGFVVDWGAGVGGMQTPPGHRDTIHDPNFREIGVGVLEGSGPAPAVGPQIVTQNFGTLLSGATPAVTGVAYFDLDGDQFYDLGEGLGDVEVSVNGSNFYAITASSGGYTVPVPGNGTYDLVFRTNGMPDDTRTITVSNDENLKADLILDYLAPEIIGTGSPMVGAEHSYQVSAVPGIDNYQVEANEFALGDVTEGAEPGEREVVIATQGGYDVIQSITSSAGSWAFHFAHPTTGHTAETVTLDGRFYITETATLQFDSRLGWAGDAQVASVEISIDDGDTWQPLYQQIGSNGAGETAFVARSLDLSGFAGAYARIRFVYALTSGAYYNQTVLAVGWVVDEIRLTDAPIVLSSQLIDLGNDPTFSYAPTAAGSSVFWRVRAQNGTRSYPYGQTVEILPVDAAGERCYTEPMTILGTTYPSGDHRLRSVGGIETRGPVEVAAGAQLTYESPGRISLAAGFRVSQGAGFVARILPVTCAGN